MEPVTRNIAQMLERASHRTAGSIDPRHGQTRNHASSQKGELVAVVEELIGPCDQQNKRRERHRIHQCDAPKQQPRAQKNRGHQCRAQNWRAVLHNAEIPREYDERDHRRTGHRQTQQSAQPENKNCQRAHVEPGHHKHVKRCRLLKRFGQFRVYKAAVAQQHRSQHRNSVRFSRVEIVEPRK